ncbi:MAG: aldehyde dehydrogenase [Bdellovibrionales bacterium]
MDFKHLLKKQREFVFQGHLRSFKQRKQILERLKELIAQNEEKLFQALNKDLGKSNMEAYFSEVAFCMREIDHTLKNLKDWMAPVSITAPLSLQPGSAQILSEPYGSALIIAPWNYPFQLQISPLIAALAAGNAAVLKPSELSPNTQEVIIEMINSAFPPEAVYCVGGGIAESTDLLQQKFDFIFFTGSPQVGRIVMSKAAENLTPVCLELGGKSPCIVHKDADLDVAARRIVWAKFFNTGQTCVAPDYVYVHESIQSTFLDKLKTTIANFFGDDPYQSKDYGRIVNSKHLHRLLAMIDSSKLVVGGGYNADENYLAPTVLSEVEWTDAVMQEEIFGPILPTLTYSDVDDVLRTLYEKPKPLAAYFFTADHKLQEKMFNAFPFGGGCINDCILHMVHPDLPFGGVGTSGIGSYHGKWGFETFSHKKPRLKKSTWGDIDFRYPPYTESKINWMRRVF